MKALVSVLTRVAAPGEVITSSGRGATAAQPSPAATPSTPVPATTARAASTAGTPARSRSRNRHERTASSPWAGSGKEIGTDMVGSSVRDTRRAGTPGAFQGGRKPCYGVVRDWVPLVRIASQRAAVGQDEEKRRDRGTGSHQALRGQARGRPPVLQ